MSNEEEKTKIESKGLNAYFFDKQVLFDISMRVFKKKVTAIIGPSGCGKSTFIRNFNRMHETVPGARAQGKILLDGKDIFDKKFDAVSLRRDVGMVFQKSNPFPMSI